MPFVVSGQIGIDLTKTSATPEQTVGTLVTATDGGVWQYVRAASTISQYAAVVLYTDGTARMAETSAVGFAEVAVRTVGFAQVSIVSAYYGWVARSGKVIFNVADDCGAGVPLFTTATPGVLDDATVSNCHIAGVYLTTTSSLATAMTGYASTLAYVSFYSNPA